MRGKSILLFGLILGTMLTGCVSSGGSSGGDGGGGSSGGGGNPPAVSKDPAYICMQGVAAALSGVPGIFSNMNFYIVEKSSMTLHPGFTTTDFPSEAACEQNRPTL